MNCYWDDWNKEHIKKHGVLQQDADYIVRHAKPPYPEDIGGGKYMVRGRTSNGKYLQVIFVFRSWDTIKVEELSVEEIILIEDAKGPFAYIIHARELTERERHVYRRRTQ